MGAGTNEDELCADRILAASAALCACRSRMCPIAVFLVLAHGGERGALVAAGCCELALAPGEPVAHGALLGRPRRDDPRRLRDLPARLPRRVPRLLHLQLRLLDLAGDLVVLPADRAQELELVEHVGEVARLEHDRQRRRALGGVDLDEPLAQARHGLPVLALEEDELARLELVELVQAVEPPLVQRKHGLELAEAGGRRVNVVLERVDLAR